MPLRIAIHGAAGRMGRRLVALAAADSAFACRRRRLAAASAPGRRCRRGGRRRGRWASPIQSASSRRGRADVVIDFSVPAAAETIIERCLAKQIPLVVATTGLGDAADRQIDAAAREIPVLWAPSMSLAVNLTMRLAEVAGRP